MSNSNQNIVYETAYTTYKFFNYVILINVLKYL